MSWTVGSVMTPGLPEEPGTRVWPRVPAVLALGVAWLCFVMTSVVDAGGGPENVFLVVNGKDTDSLTIANHYRRLRSIPSVNVFQLDWTGSRDTIEVEVFRQQILQPILTEIDRRHLTGQIDYVVYSSGFPFAVNFAGDQRVPAPKESGNIGSLTGLTYLYQWVMERDGSYAFSMNNQQANHYYGTNTQGFRHAYEWNQNGERIATNGRRFLLSTMLGYVGGRGNTVDDVVRYLRRSAMADGSHPQGTVYLMRVPNEVRTQTREGSFAVVAGALRQHGVNAVIAEGAVPDHRDDVLGAVIGRASVDWAGSGSRFVPGAICDNLTSFGGILRTGATQTPLTDFLDYGPAGASGTVVEPFALQAKFPHPWMFVHYARGATLAESFYQSLASPYQLLVVGDPLCCPFARSPVIGVQSLQPGQSVQGTFDIQPIVGSGPPVGEIRLLIDGRLIESIRPGAAFQVDSTKLSDGYHDFRLVAVDTTQLESQGRLILPLLVENHQVRVKCAIEPRVVEPFERAALSLQSDGAAAIYVFHERNLVARLNRASGKVAIDPQSTGRGPVELTVVAIGAEQNQKYIAEPIRMLVKEAPAVSSF